MTCQDPPIRDPNASRQLRNDEMKRKPNMFQRLFLRLKRKQHVANHSTDLLGTTSTTILSSDKPQHAYNKGLGSVDKQLESGNRRDEPSHTQPTTIDEKTVRPDGMAMAQARPTSESSTNSGTTTADTTLQCDSCLDDFPLAQMTQSACSHRYCETCLETIIRTAMADASMFPPRCCKQELGLPIPPKLARECSAKLEECGTPYNRRVYCQQRTCSEFIPQYWIVGDIALCFHCGQKTCTHCKSSPHGEEDCPMDTAMLSLLALAHKKGYQRCYNCRRLVERMSGCNMMSKSRS